MTRRVLCALLAASTAPLLLSAQDGTNSGQWMIDFQGDGQIQLTLHREQHEHSFSVSADSFRGLSRGATHFEYVRDAGTFRCDGHFAGDHGAGIFVFEPNPKYIADMKSLGYQIEPEHMMELATFDISRAFVRDLARMGYRGLSLSDLFRFRAQGVTPIHRVLDDNPRP